MKKQSYKILSNKKCVACGNNLKQNLVDRNPDAEYCYKHYPKSKKNRPTSNHRASFPKEELRPTSEGVNSMADKNYSEEAKVAFPDVTELVAMDLYAQKLYKELRQMADVGQDSGKEYNRKRRKYRAVRDRYLEMRDNYIEQESNMTIKN